MIRCAAVFLMLAGACAAPPPPPSEAGGKYWHVEDPIGKAGALSPAPADLEALQEAAHLYRVSIQRDGDTFAALWKCAMTLCRIAQATASEEVQAASASEALEYAKRAARLETLRVEAHYYTALSAGLLAETMSVGALSYVSTIETEATEARRLDPGYDGAAPLLLLGELYSKAPGFPLSVGDVDLALELLQEAVRLAPDRQANRIALAEVYLDDRVELDGGLDKVEEARKVVKPLEGSKLDLPPRWPERWAKVRTRLGSP